MTNFLLFCGLSIAGWVVTRPPWRTPSSPGVYRFVAGELLLGLSLLSPEVWLGLHLSLAQIFSWVCLGVALGLLLAGLAQRKTPTPPPAADPAAPPPYVPRRGVYAHIRHPLSAAALSFGWGVFSPSLAAITTVSLFGALLLTAASLLLIAAARLEEAENYTQFGAAYAAHLKTTKMFIPFIF